MSWAKSAVALLATAALVAVSSGNAAAADFQELAAPASEDRARAIDCMTSAILYEAGFEPREGQEAVAEVVLNRLRSPAFPKTVCGVVFQGSGRRTGCQFSFTCDGSLRKILPIEALMRAREVASQAINGLLTPRTSGATHYHADYVSPYWAPTLIRIATIGRHIFYRQPGADEFSHLGRYEAAGERMPSSLGGAIRGSSAAALTVAREKPGSPEKFMPWGLSPETLSQAQSATKR